MKYRSVLAYGYVAMQFYTSQETHRDREAFSRFLNYFSFSISITQVVPPVGDSRTDWAIFSLLMEKIQERAIARGETSFRDRQGKERQLERVYEDYSFNRRYGPEDDEALLAAIAAASSNLDKSWEEMKEVGHARLTGVGSQVDLATDIKPDETISPGNAKK